MSLSECTTRSHSPARSASRTAVTKTPVDVEPTSEPVDVSPLVVTMWSSKSIASPLARATARRAPAIAVDCPLASALPRVPSLRVMAPSSHAVARAPRGIQRRRLAAMIAMLDARIAAKMAIHRATLLNPEEPDWLAEGAALGVAELGGADAMSGGTAPADAVGPGVAATEDDGDVFAGASATYERVPSTGCPSPATTRHARVRFPADMEGSTTCADVGV